MQQRTESGIQGAYGQGPQRQVWTFRVETFDEEGNRLQPIPVEMRAVKLPGVLSEGDSVRIPGRWRPGQTLHPKQMRNLTTQGLVGVNPGHPFWRGLGIFLALLITLAIGVVSLPYLYFSISQANVTHPSAGPMALALFSLVVVVAFWVWLIQRVRQDI